MIIKRLLKLGLFATIMSGYSLFLMYIASQNPQLEYMLKNLYQMNSNSFLLGCTTARQNDRNTPAWAVDISQCETWAKEYSSLLKDKLEEL